MTTTRPNILPAASVFNVQQQVALSSMVQRRYSIMPTSIATILAAAVDGWHKVAINCWVQIHRAR